MNFFEGVVEFFKGFGEFFAGVGATIVNDFRTDPELRAMMLLLGIMLIACAFGWFNCRIASRTSYLVMKNDGYQHAMYSRNLHRFNYGLVRVEAIILFCVEFYCFYTQYVDLFWCIFANLFFEVFVKELIKEFENNERKYNISAAKEYNEERDKVELASVMEFYSPMSLSESDALCKAIISLQDYRRRTGKIGDIVCVEPRKEIAE